MAAVICAAALLLASLCGAADVARAPGPQASAPGLSLPAAVRLVALRNPAISLPPGITPERLQALPADAPLWRRAAEEVARTTALDYELPSSEQDPAAVVGRALRQVAKEPGLWRVEAAPGAKPAAPPEIAWDGAHATPESLVVQADTQKNKNTYRGLADAEALLSHASARWQAPAAANASLHPLLASAHPIEALTADAERRHGRLIWADIGGGAGFLQREWAARHPGSPARRILVDLFDWESTPLGSDQVQGFKKRAAALAPEHRPELVLADAAAVRFEAARRPNLITSFVSVTYWPDKLKAIAHLYNELADDGVLLITAGDVWPRWFVSETSAPLSQWPRLVARALIGRGRRPLMARALDALTQAGVQVLATKIRYDRELGHSIAIRKKPGTRLEAAARLAAPIPRADSGYMDSRYVRSDAAPLVLGPSER